MHKDKKAVIGIISVEGDETHVTEEEFRLALSDHVEIVMAYAPLEKVSYNGLMAFLDKLPGAVDEFGEYDGQCSQRLRDCEHAGTALGKTGYRAGARNEKIPEDI